MKNNQVEYEEKKLAQILRQEVLNSVENLVKPEEKVNVSDFEYISTNESYVSPIFTMSEDEILNFVEEFEVSELATLSEAELNHIGKVLGVDPKILQEKEN